MTNVVTLNDYRTHRKYAALRRQLISSYKNKVLAMTKAERTAEKQALAQHIKACGRCVDLVTRIRVELFLEVENG